MLQFLSQFCAVQHTWSARLSPIIASMVYVMFAPAKDSIRDFRPAGNSQCLIISTSIIRVPDASESNANTEGRSNRTKKVLKGCIST